MTDATREGAPKGTIRVAGHTAGSLLHWVGGKARCGDIVDGISLRFDKDRGGFVVSRAELLEMADRLRSASKEEGDAARMDWLESRSVEAIYFVGGGEFKPRSQSLRAAIDGELPLRSSRSTPEGETKP